jgi:hypothetical protein
LRSRDMSGGRQRGSARGQKQKFSAGKIHICHVRAPREQRPQRLTVHMQR